MVAESLLNDIDWTFDNLNEFRKHFWAANKARTWIESAEPNIANY